MRLLYEGLGDKMDKYFSRNAKWSKESEELLKEKIAEGYDCEYIAEYLGRSTNAIILRANKLGLSVKKKNTVNRWTPEDDMILKEMYREGATADEIAYRLDRTVYAVRARLGKIK